MDLYTASEEAYKRGYEKGREEKCGRCAECCFFKVEKTYTGTELTRCFNPKVPVVRVWPDFGCTLFERKEKDAHEG